MTLTFMQDYANVYTMNTLHDSDPASYPEDERQYDGTAEDVANINYGRDTWVHPDETRTDAEVERDERIAAALHMSGALDSDEYWEEYYGQFEERWMGDVSLELHETIIESGIDTEDDLVAHLKNVFGQTANTSKEIYDEDAERVAKDLLDRHKDAEDPVKSAVGELAFEANKQKAKILENATKWLAGNGETAEQIEQRYTRIISAEWTGCEKVGYTSLAAQEIALHQVEIELGHEADDLERDRNYDSRDDYDDEDGRYDGTAEDLANIEYGMDRVVSPDETEGH